MQLTKTFFLTIAVVLLSLFATSCIPTVPGENPAANTNFNIDASYLLNLQQSPTVGAEKLVIVDGDTLSFTVGLGFYATTWSSMNMDYYCSININGAPFSNNTLGYSVLCNRNSIDFSSSYFGALFDAGITINDNYADSLNSFESLTYASYNQLFLVQKNYVQQGTLDQFRFPINTDKYIVLRKSKVNGNQYYWIKMRREGIYLINETIKAVSGKYQMNSITTGQ